MPKRVEWRNRITGHGDESPTALVENPANWRRHPKRQADALAGVLSEVGWVQDVIVNRQTNRLIDGHLRVALAVERKEATIPVVYVDLSEAEEALILATLDPLSALAGTDAAQLRALLDEVSTGEAAVQEMLAGLAKAAGLDMKPAAEDPGAQIDRAAELQVKWQTARGQVWEVGRHRLMCGDSTSAEDVASMMGGEREWSLLTDPPYGIDAASMTMGSGKREFPREGEWDKARIDIARFVAEAGLSIVWGGNYYADVLPITADWLCWYKRNDGLSFSEFELAWSNVGRRARLIAHHWSGEMKQHITQKPAEVMVWCAGFLPIDQPAFDPFLGSGTTMVAAEQTGRVCYGMEIAPPYVAVALERLSGMGLTPRLVESGANE